MGFPLDRGNVKDGILTCHWHHARFDLATGGTFDPWADDVRVFPVDVRGNEVWIDIIVRDDPKPYQRVRVREGMEQNIPLVLAKAVILLTDRGENPASPFRMGLEFGTRYRRSGWGQGLTMLTCNIPLLFFTQEDANVLEDIDRHYDGPPAYIVGPNILNAWIHGDLLTVNMLGMAHAEFSSMFQLQRECAALCGKPGSRLRRYPD
jgi:hypothetical protein